MTAAWADSDDPDPSQRQALEWLERQGAPGIAASDAVPRSVGSHFVPVNDATIVGRALQQRRADKVYGLMDQIDRELTASGGEITATIRRLQKKLARERDVTSPVSKVGKASDNVVDAALRMFPPRRKKQERWFPSVCPDVPRVVYVWNVSAPGEALAAMDRLLRRVTRLGHSSTLVSCRVVSDPPEPSYVVAEHGGGKSMRSVRPGQLAELERLHAQHRASSPRSLPFTDARYVPASSGGTSGDKAAEHDTVGEWIVFEFTNQSRYLPSTRSAEIAAALRTAVLAHADREVPEGVSGLGPNGLRSTRPHVAFIPIPFVGFAHADGRILGIAISIPRELDQSSRTALYRAVGRWEQSVRGSPPSSDTPLTLRLANRRKIELRRLVGSSHLVSLRRRVWQRPAQRWVSVTPIALPRHPGSLTRGSVEARKQAWLRAEDGVRLACDHIGLSQPDVVEVSLDPLIVGCQHVSRFPPFLQGRRGAGLKRQLVHVCLTFGDPVSGPMLLGSGRFLGLGLMRPMASDGSRKG